MPMKRNDAAPSMRVPPPGPRSQKWITYHRVAAARATYLEGFVWDRAAPAVGDSMRVSCLTGLRRHDLTAGDSTPTNKRFKIRGCAGWYERAN